MFDEIKTLLDEQQLDKVKSHLKGLHPVEIANLLHEVDSANAALLFRLLNKDTAIDVFDHMEVDEKEELLSALQNNQVINLLNEMSPDERTELFEELPAKVVKKYLSLLNPEKRRVAHELLGYEKDSAGRLMTPEFVDLKMDQTVEEALVHVRATAPDKETIYYCYVISPLRHLVGLLSLRELILSPPDKLVKDIMHTEVISVTTDTNQEEAARILSEYDLIAVPVVDRENRLVGIITYDDVLDVVEEESTEDIHIMGGLSTVPEDVRYLDLSLFGSIRKRLFWLLLLIVLASISGSILKVYSGVLESVVALAFFVPMLTDTGGNTGTQAATLITRAMAVGEFEGRHALRIIAREAITGVVLGTLVGAFAFLRAYTIEQDLRISFLVAVSLMTIVLIANLAGTILPLIAKRLKLDPAVMAGPLITTIVDIVGLIVYFQIAKLILGSL